MDLSLVLNRVLFAEYRVVSSASHRDYATEGSVSQGQPLLPPGYSSLVYGLSSIISMGSVLSEGSPSYPIGISMGSGVSSIASGHMGVIETEMLVPYSNPSVAHLDSEGSGQYGGWVGPSASRGSGHSFTSGVGDMSVIPK